MICSLRFLDKPELTCLHTVILGAILLHKALVSYLNTKIQGKEKNLVAGFVHECSHMKLAPSSFSFFKQHMRCTDV